MKVSFISFGDRIASSRLRAIIPAKHCGLEQGDDVVVYGKHVLTEEHLAKYGKRVFDVCDDHFSSNNYYTEHCRTADLITCNSETMKGIIKQHTGRDAVVIKDPYETEAKTPGAGKGYCWYGHASNLPDLLALKLPSVTVLTGEAWSMDKQRRMIHSHAAVLIPTGFKQAKSANRLIEAVQNGRFAICGDLPAYREFSDWVWVGDVREGIMHFEQYQNEFIKNLHFCQEYIEQNYSPKVIGKQWREVLQSL
jgi:hypothetical protein